MRASAQWTDNFSDGNFTASPVWKGDSTNFFVNAQSQLQLKATAVAGSSYLSTVSTIGCEASWSFLIKMDFNPSSSNYAKVYLMADQANLTLPLHGYFLRIGGTNDDLCLFRQEGATETLVADGRDKVFNTSTVNARIKVSRNASNQWELLCDTTGTENYSLSASAYDESIVESGFFGVQCIYTSTRSDKFYFDDFVITGETWEQPKPVTDSTKLYDVVFNEIMADPTPVAGLPESEYLELYNRSQQAINLKGWKLTAGSYTYVFPDFTLASSGYLIVSSKADTDKFKSFGQTFGLFTSSTALNNTGQYLSLRNRDDKLIDWLEYDNSWYGDEFKSQGGWSLEQIDPLNPCGGKANWKASTANAGGTPGSKNAVYSSNTDGTIPNLFRINVPKDTLIELYFTEPLDTVAAISLDTYSLTPDIGKPKQAVICNKNLSAVELTMPSPLSSGKTYNLHIKNLITDCVGNRLSQEITVPIGLTALPDSLDVTINEVLFNAKSGGADYVELYNRSTKMINARNLLLGIKKDGKVSNLCRLSEAGFLIGPAEYLVISGDCNKIKPFYTIKSEKCFVDLSSMPTLDDKSSTIVLQNDTFGKIDEFAYAASMHLPTLKNLEGISLERTNPNSPTYLPGVWHSAAESAGYGTPGYQNSQYLTDTVASSSIVLSDDIFSPDNDGYNDVLQISYQFNKTACRMQVFIFDSSGRLVRRLLNNELLGTAGSFSWDGTSDAGKLCNVGMYVIFVRTVWDDGLVKEYKRSCVLAIKR